MTRMPDRTTKSGGAAALLCAVLLGGCSFGGWTNYSHEAKTIVELESGGADAFRIENGVGDVRIVGSAERTEVRTLVELVGLGTTDVQALERLGEMDAKLVYEGGTLVARVDHPAYSGNTPYAAYWSIEVPAGTVVGVRTDVGDVVIAGEVGDVKVSTDVGDVWVDALGSVTVRSDVGDVTARGAGVMDVASDVGDVTMCYRSLTPVAQRVQADVGDVYVVLPPSFQGTVKASADVGDSLIDMGESGRADGEGSLTLVLGTSRTATFTASTDVGDVTVVASEDHGAMGEEPDLDVPESGEAVSGVGAAH